MSEHTQLPAPAASASVDGVLHVPARDIPMPESISAAARAYLAQVARMPSMNDVPDGADLANLRKRIIAFGNAVG